MRVWRIVCIPAVAIAFAAGWACGGENKDGDKGAAEGKVTAPDLSSVAKAADAVCGALNDGRPAAVDAVYDTAAFEKEAASCNLAAQIRECGGIANLRDCDAKDKEFPDCKASAMREKFVEFVKGFKSAGETCSVVAASEDSATLSTYKKTEEKIMFVQVEKTWRPRPPIGGFLPKARMAWLEVGLRERLGDDTFEELKGAME